MRTGPSTLRSLNPQTACTFTLPSSHNFARRKTLDKYLRRTVPARYKGMKGSVLFFDFPNSHERDEFLRELQQMVEANGQQTARTTAAPNP